MKSKWNNRDASNNTEFDWCRLAKLILTLLKRVRIPRKNCNEEKNNTANKDMDLIVIVILEDKRR